MGLELFVLSVLVGLPGVLGQATECFGAGSVAGAAVGAFLGALLLVVAAYYLRKLYWKSRKGKHLVFSTDPESVKDEFAFDNPGFRTEEGRQGWQHDAPTLPMGGGGKNHPLHAEFARPNEAVSAAGSKDDLHLEKARIRRVKLWARDFTGLGLTCAGGAREGVRVQSVLRSGPAAAAGLVPGDRIKSITIEFTGTVLEDAVGILSLASPYPVELVVAEGARTSGVGRATAHPVLRRAGSAGDIAAIERESKLLLPPKSPNTSHSNNSTLETKTSKGGIKKIITEKIITTTTLERAKKEKREHQASTLERENEKNVKLANKRFSDIPAMNKPERNKTRHSSGSEVQIIQPENGIMHVDKMDSETQRRESDPKKGMKFGIRVLPPNIPDDGVLKQSKNIENGVVNVERKSVDQPDKGVPYIKSTEIRLENEVIEAKAKPAVAKRREKSAPPVPNARNLIKQVDSDMDLSSHNNSQVSDSSVITSFARSDLNSSGIKRDENGIPQELPQHMLEAAMAARNNRKSVTDILADKDRNIESRKDSDLSRNNKKSKGKAPSPPEPEKNKTDDNIIEQLKKVNDFLQNEKHHSSLLHDSISLSPSDQSSNSYNTSTPKINKLRNVSTLEETINFSQDDIDDIVSKPFRRESDSLNNFYEDSKSNLSSNQDGHSVVSLNNSDKGSTTIELNNSDITIHSSPLNDTLHSTSDEASTLDDNERKAASLGDLSRFELRHNTSKPSQGTLERAQSLDISADDAEIQNNVISPKKRKANSVVENSFFSDGNEDDLPDMIDSDKGRAMKHKEPRLSLNIAKSSAMEGLSTFQRNRLKKGSEFGNLEDAIVKGSSSSLDSNNADSINLQKQHTYEHNMQTQKAKEEETDSSETSDHLAKRIMDENLKVHFKLVSDFAKSTSDGSNMSSLESSHELYTAKPVSTELPSLNYDEKVSLNYDTNIPDDLKVSRHSLVSSLERPKSDMMKKLLAKNPALNVHVDQSVTHTTESATRIKESAVSSVTDAPKIANIHQPDIVNFNLKGTEQSHPKEFDDFVSNIRVGSNNNSLNYEKKVTHEPYGHNWSKKATGDTQNVANVVTISTTEQTQPPIIKETDVNKISKSYTKSIEIGEPIVRQVPDVIDGVNRHSTFKSTIDKDAPIITKGSRTLYMEPQSVALTLSQEPMQKTVTVNVAEDEFGNKVITQNIEKVSTRYMTAKTEVPLQVEQVSYGIMRNASEINQLALEEGDNDTNIDERILQEIKRQNPDTHFMTDEPAFSKTETIILNTNLDEEQALALMEKLKNDESFISQRTSEELSQLGIRIIHDLEDRKSENEETVEVTKTRYTINPATMSTTEKYSKYEDDKSHRKIPKPEYSHKNYKVDKHSSEANKNHITEIQVITPKTDKLIKQKSDLTQNRQHSQRKRSASYSEPELSYELDISLLNDFITNERRHSSKEMADPHYVQHERFTSSSKEELREPRNKHSDFDLPRNSHIKFRTATYESPKGTLVTSTDLETKRLSQMDMLRTNFEKGDAQNSPAITAKPLLSPKPSNIPVKMQDKSKTVVSPSKIPVFMSQKSLSQENLSDRSMSLPRSPPQLGGSSGNISITSIKSSSRNPSGK